MGGDENKQLVVGRHRLAKPPAGMLTQRRHRVRRLIDKENSQ